MARRCEVCGKKAVAGNNVSHSKRRTRRMWKPNVQKATLQVEGAVIQVRICTRCLRSQKKVTT